MFIRTQVWLVQNTLMTEIFGLDNSSRFLMLHLNALVNKTNIFVNFLKKTAYVFSSIREKETGITKYNTIKPWKQF